MPIDRARDVAETTEPSLPGGRLGRADRRDALLDAAARLISRGGLDAASMEAVADEAGVSRPLVYKHFPNRVELLGELRRREAGRLHVDLRDQVRASLDAVGMFRTLVHASLQATEERGALFVALRAASGYYPEHDAEQHERDKVTVRAFAARVSREYSVPKARAEAAVAILLAGIDSVLEQWRSHRTAANARLLEQTYMQIVTASLDSLSVDSGA